MNERLKELVNQFEEWPTGVQKEAIASLEKIAGYVKLFEPSFDDR